MGAYISTFASGMAFMFFIGAALQMNRRKQTGRAYLFLEILLTLMAMLELKNLVMSFTGASHNPNADGISLLVDSIAVSACAIYLFEFLWPGWFTKFKRTAIGVAYLVVVGGCTATLPNEHINTNLLFIAIYGVIATLVLAYFIIRFSTLLVVYPDGQRINKNRFLGISVAMIICLGLWMSGRVYHMPWVNVFYEVASITLWTLIIMEADHDVADSFSREYAVSGVRYSEYAVDGKDEVGELTMELQQELEADEEEVPIVHELPPFPFDEQLTRVMDEEQIYRNQRLTINDVANAMGTNRTYLSVYLNSVLHTTFYDYINNYRIEQVSIPLLKQLRPPRTMEEIAELSGFSSVTTFRRAFLKKMGITPMNYRKLQ
jgi:AraC-like DNA-binding protein